jgi:predicted DNA-binding transcriptional regulator YafY
VSSLESHIHINTVQDVFNNIPDALEILFESIAEKKQVFLKYRSVQSDSSTERMVEPVGLFHQNNFWYIMGYCHLRKDYRQFRTDRMLKIRRTDLGNTLVHGPLDDYYPKQDDCVKTKVRILVDKRVAPLLQSNRKYYGFVSEKIKKNRVEMTFMARDLEQGFARWYLMFGDYARILEPERLKERVREILTRTEAALD